MDEAPVAQQTIPQNAAFQTEDLDAYDSDCDDLSSAKEILMANLFKLKYKIREIDTLKETLSTNVKEKESLSTALNVFKTESKEKEYNYIDEEIVLEKHNKELENILFLKDIFNAFDKTLLDEIIEVQTIFNQMEAAVDQCSEIVHIAMNSVDILDVNKSCVDECSKCLELETELLKKNDFIEKDVYDKLSQEKDTVIGKLKDIIKSLMDKEGVENVKKDIDEIETINIELEHSVAKLLSKNENLRNEREHLKSIYKDQFDSIKKTRV
ncbi:hypothetical protein Tco_0736366 [Tanacetum coccineum]